MTEILGSPAFLPLAMFGAAFLFSVVYLAWDALK